MNKDEIKKTLVREYGFSEEAVEIGIRARFQCEYCGRPLLDTVDDYDAWHRDHIIPVSKNGSGELSNLSLACKPCNFFKSNWTPSDSSFRDASRKAKIERIKEHLKSVRAIKENKLEAIRQLARQLIPEQTAVS